MEPETQERSAKMMIFKLVLNCLMLVTGIGGGPLLMRLYYVRGGKSIWLSSWLETGGWPIILIPLVAAYFRRRAVDPTLVFINLNTLCYASVIGLLAGLGDYCYAYGVKKLPVSTSSLILATQLAFTAVFAFIIVKQKFTAYSVNAVALLTFGAIVLALHANSDKPAWETRSEYYLGWSFTLAAAAAFAIILPMIELTYKRAKQRVTYYLVLEIQLVLSFSATAVCTIGMLASGDYKGYAEEANIYEFGKVLYFVVLVCDAIVWQFFYIGAAGVIYYGSSMLSAIIIAVALPITEVGAVIFFREKFEAEKGVSLVLSLWGFVSYFYGEAQKLKKAKKERANNTELTDVELTDIESFDVVSNDEESSSS